MQRNKKERYRLWQNNIMEPETCEEDLLAAEDAEVLSSHGSCFRTAGKRNRASWAIHSSRERVKQLKKTNNWIPVIILNKALIEETNITCLGGRFVQYFLFPDLMTRRMLRFSRAWEREEGGILVSSPRSGCPVRSHENAASSVQTSFFAIEYLLSLESRGCRNPVFYLLSLSLR